MFCYYHQKEGCLFHPIWLAAFLSDRDSLNRENFSNVGLYSLTSTKKLFYNHHMVLFFSCAYALLVNFMKAVRPFYIDDCFS